jgi:type II secretory pathway component PulJ
MPEMLVTVAVTAILGGFIWTVYAFGTRNFQALANYADMEAEARYALDLLSAEVRSAQDVTNFTSQGLWFRDGDGQSLRYVYDSTNKVLVRQKGAASKTLLTGCDTLSFALFERTPTTNALGDPCWDLEATTNARAAKMLQVSWEASRSILGQKQQTKNVVMAQVGIRGK